MHPLLRKALPLFALAALLSSSLAACVPTAIGAGASVGEAAAEERGVKGAVSDDVIKAKILNNYTQADYKLLGKISVDVMEGRVMLTGTVVKAETRAQAVSLAWKVAGVKQVIDEVVVTGEGGGLSEYAHDAWISAQLKSALLFDRDVSSVNYDIETVGGVVYILGIAQNQAELDRVLNHARHISYVRRVVNHVWLRSDPRRFQ